ncbi:MAG: SigE family RNA polymerase sigma factor [Micromonosporaceae bacterium]|nr:SigE family RNA polymerase sigma factor [Micromonosporaceae bacterium]
MKETCRPDFGQFYAAHFQVLTVQLYAHTGDLAESQDIVQEAFCRALERWSQVSRYDEPVAWVRRVAWNLATSRWRRLRVASAFARRHRDEPVAGPGPERVAMVRALARLPEQQRRVVVLHYLADLTVPSIATELGVPEGTVKSWLHRARAALASQLELATEGGTHV